MPKTAVDKYCDASPAEDYIDKPSRPGEQAAIDSITKTKTMDRTAHFHLRIRIALTGRTHPPLRF
jgi:hypothetical protein